MKFSLLLISTLSYTLCVSASPIVTSTDAKLPQSFASIVKDLQADGCQNIKPACLITSRTVTKAQKQNIQNIILENQQVNCKAAATKSGIALAIPDTLECVPTAITCQGSIIYYPSNIDLQRQEGLFDTLAPIIEKVVNQQIETNLVIVSDNPQQTKQLLQEAAQQVLPNLITNKPLAVLQDAFQKVVYVTPQQVSENLSQIDAASYQQESKAIAVVAPKQISSSGLAAARNMGPAARNILADSVNRVRMACVDGTRLKLNPEFGALCDAAIKQAMVDLEQSSAFNSNSALGQQIKSDLQAQMLTEFEQVFHQQLDLVEQATFDEFKKKLSKLLISPNLGNDMDAVVNESVSAFAKAAKKLVASKSDWSIGPAKQMFATKTKEHCKNRLMAAEASGQYRPLPRKGVTVGLHWLLPKPFGNDFRQEPWLVHATDNMVYVPKGKVSNVGAEDVRSGDWRDKIVPSPIGNDIVYMQ